MTGRAGRRLRPASALSLVGLVRMSAAAGRFARIEPGAPPIDVTAVIPARDEAHQVGDCVRSLLGQCTRVVVVDDDSADATAAVAAEAGAKVVHLAGDPPPGWTGKARACWAGAQQADTTWIAFVDADVVMSPWALPSLAMDTTATSTSVVGGLRCETFWDRLLLPELGLVLAQEGLPEHFASGQCFLVRADHYHQVGGHSHPRVRGSLVEDSALARVLGGHDARLGPGLLRTGMYRGLGQVWSGLVKNSAVLHPHLGRHLLWILGPVATRRPWPAMGLSAAGRAVAGQNPAYGLLAPLARVVLAANYLTSVWRHRQGRAVAWKGRAVATR